MVIESELKKYRLKKGITQAQLAKTVGIAERYYQELEYSKSLPNAHTTIRLAKALGVNVTDLFPLPEEEKTTTVL